MRLPGAAVVVLLVRPEEEFELRLSLSSTLPDAVLFSLALAMAAARFDGPPLLPPNGMVGIGGAGGMLLACPPPLLTIRGGPPPPPLPPLPLSNPGGGGGGGGGGAPVGPGGATPPFIMPLLVTMFGAIIGCPLLVGIGGGGGGGGGMLPAGC